MHIRDHAHRSISCTLDPRRLLTFREVARPARSPAASSTAGSVASTAERSDPGRFL
jgi:hypothetical protein